jgi:hypothetical protein
MKPVEACTELPFAGRQAPFCERGPEALAGALPGLKLVVEDERKSSGGRSDRSGGNLKGKEFAKCRHLTSDPGRGSAFR